jgi:LemA protein
MIVMGMGMILLIGAVVIGLIFFMMYNTLIGKKNQVENAFSTVDVMLKKRYDLIPNLVSTVKTYMNYEGSTLEKITELRAKAISGGISSDEKVSLDNEIRKTMGSIMVAVENYPELKANENFIHLQRTLNETEEQISAARRTFNATVVDYNNSVEMFPTNIIAGMMGYSRKSVFEASDEERKNINVGNLFNN